MAVGRESSRTTYQLLVSVGNTECGVNESTFIRAACVLYEWMRREVAADILLPQLPATVSASAKNGQSVAAIYEPEQCFFTMRYTCFVKKHVARRTVEAELCPDSARLCLAVRQTESREAGSGRERPAEPPAFVEQLIREMGLSDGQPLIGKPWHIGGDQAAALVDFLQSPRRTLPLLLISQAKNPGVGMNGYLLDSRALAKSMTGFAHVAEIEWDATLELSRLVENEWSCFGGAARIYWPEPICFEMDDPYRHPLYIARSIRQNLYGRSVESELQLSIVNSNAEMPVDWSAHGVKFFIEAEQERILSDKGELRTEELLRQCQEQLRRVHGAMEEYRTLAEEYYADMRASRQDSEALHQQMQAMVSMAERQRNEIIRLRSGKKEQPPTDGGYRGMAAWVARYYPDRLYLHPRAVRTLKSAVYQNPSMVYRCLILLAEDYYDYRKGRISREAFIRRCAAVDPGLTECGFGTASDILEQGETYYVTYAGQRRLLDRHLKKGSSHNPLYCLRIYFFWDETTSHVVIGSLPGHLRSSLT